MIMSMYNIEKVVCVTNRHLAEDFLPQIEKVIKYGVKTIILREKDLSAGEYEALAKQVLAVCEKNGADCILHSFYETAVTLCEEAQTGGCPMKPSGLHLPMQAFLSLTEEQKKKFAVLGVSVHSPEEAKECEQLGATYLTAGHIFATDCKKGVPPRGISYLKEVCDSVKIPVYAIGGIHEGNMQECLDVGAAKVCMMSNLMRI